MHAKADFVHELLSHSAWRRAPDPLSRHALLYTSITGQVSQANQRSPKSCGQSRASRQGTRSNSFTSLKQCLKQCNPSFQGSKDYVTKEVPSCSFNAGTPPLLHAQARNSNLQRQRFRGRFPLVGALSKQTCSMARFEWHSVVTRLNVRKQPHPPSDSWQLLILGSYGPPWKRGRILPIRSYRASVQTS